MTTILEFVIYAVGLAVFAVIWALFIALMCWLSDRSIQKALLRHAAAVEKNRQERLRNCRI